MPWLQRPQFKNYDDPLGPKFEGHFAGVQTADCRTIKVVSYNICQGQAVQKAIEAFRSLEPLPESDIILLQEVDEAGTEQIALELGYNYVYYPASLPFMQERKLGNAILARWPLTQASKLLLPYRHPVIRQQRIAVRAVVSIGKLELPVYSVHTEIYSTLIKYRISQLAALVEDIGPGTAPVIVGGDFNTLSPASIARTENRFKEIGLVRASKRSGPTLDVLGIRLLAADHIFTRGFQVIASGVVGAATASDHVPVWVNMIPFHDVR